METINFMAPKFGVSTKTFEFIDGKWELTKGYKAGKIYKGFECPVENIEEAFEVIKTNQEFNCFMIHGGFIEGTDLSEMYRRKRENKDGVEPTICNRPIHFFCVDIDGYYGTIAEYIQNELPEEFHTADFIYQYSSSYGLTNETDLLKCHLFFWLEEAVMNTDIHAWMQKERGNIQGLDPAPLTSNQPLYIQRRICEGAEDPIEDFIGLVKKEGTLKWTPPISGTGRQTKSEKQSAEDFDLKKAVTQIMCADNYHESIRSIALSMVNRKIPGNTVKAMLKGTMEAAPLQDKRWQDRYDDIDRAVDSAVDIVDNITLEEFIIWVHEATRIEVQTTFQEKCFKFQPFELTEAFNEVCRKTGYGISVVKSQFKAFKKEHDKELERIAKEARSNERKAMGLFEVEVTVEKYNTALHLVRKILSESKKEPRVYCMGGGLTSVVNAKPATITQCKKLLDLTVDYPKMPIFHGYKQPYNSLEERIRKEIVFVDEKGNDINPPVRLIGTVPSNIDNFKPVTGIVEHPFVDDNWETIMKNGYDEATGLVTVIHDKMKELPIPPKKAYQYLKNVVFDEFPFKSELDVAVAIAALCTAIQKPTITCNVGFPGFGIVSPTQSSGKTTLAQLISHSVYNRPVAATSWPNNDDEFEKHLLAILQEGHSCVLLDNIREGTAITNDKLATVMTSESFSGRKLGENRTVTVPSSVVWLFTGNNISFVGDFATRVYPIRITPDSENPDTRKFKRPDIGQWAMDNRKRIISACLSIIKSGKDIAPLKDSSRFTKWDKFVRTPIFYASGGIDINDAVKSNQKEDPEKLIKSNLLEQLYEVFGDNYFVTKEVVTKAFGTFEADDTELGDALYDVLDKKAKSTKSIGKYLSGMVDVHINGLKLQKIITNKAKWRLVKCDCNKG